MQTTMNTRATTDHLTKASTADKAMEYVLQVHSVANRDNCTIEKAAGTVRVASPQLHQAWRESGFQPQLGKKGAPPQFANYEAAAIHYMTFDGLAFVEACARVDWAHPQLKRAY